jgi:deoxycytidylate deaminase
VIRLSSTGELRNSKPCENCLNIIRKCGITKVQYSSDNDTIEKMILSRK